MRPEVCKGCGSLRPTLAIEQGDEFCSTVCARRHYGTLVGERRTLSALRTNTLDKAAPARSAMLLRRSRTRRG
jgi:hypothetical protein